MAQSSFTTHTPQHNDQKTTLDKWLLRAYEGDREAQFKVAVLYNSNDLSNDNKEQAVYWFKQAARQGHVLAQYNYGHHLMTADGVEKNESLAIRWWLEAALQNHPLAQFNVGRAYYLGIGIEEDHEQSLYWFKRGAQNQETKSIEILEKLRQQVITSNIQTTGVQPSSTQPIHTQQDVDLSVSLDPIELYTDPAISNVVITLFAHPEQLKAQKIGDTWTSVTSPGLPVWVHSNFLDLIPLSDNNNSKVINALSEIEKPHTKKQQAIVTADAVNTRTQPEITNNNIVGRLNLGETLWVIETKSPWYKVTAPARFVAWVKTSEYLKNRNSNSSSLTASTSPVAPTNFSTTYHSQNEWLFSQNKDHYTLQLASIDSADKVAHFLASNNLSGDTKLHRFDVRSKGSVLIYFLYGVYTKITTAQNVQQSINHRRALVRTFGELQQNRCLTWKTTLPTPPELNQYCN